MNTYPRESTEFLEVIVEVDGEQVTDYQVQLAPYNERPGSEWAAPVQADGKRGVMVTGLQPGMYRIWAKVSDNPETPVVDCGLVLVT